MEAALSIRKRAEGLFQIRVYAGIDTAGRSKYAYRTVKGTLRDAKAEEIRLRAVAGVLTRPNGKPAEEDITFATFAARWLELYAAPNLSPRTVHSYEQTLRVHINPALGHLKMRSITTDEIQRFINALPNSRRRGEGALLPSSIRSIHRILSVVFNRAVKSGVIPVNVCRNVALPRAVPKRVRSLTIDEIRRFITAAEDDYHADILITAITTGLRRGELVSLKWSAVDLKAGTITVKEGGSRPGMPKSEAGYRTVIMPQLLIERLRNRQIAQIRKRLAVPKWNAGDYVFPNKDGELMHTTSSVSTACRRVLLYAGIDIPDFRVHDLRAAHASALADAGLPIREIANRLGHADTSVTMQYYVRASGHTERMQAFLDALTPAEENGDNSAKSNRG